MVLGARINVSGDAAPKREVLTGDVAHDVLSQMWEIELSPPSCNVKGGCKSISVFGKLNYKLPRYF